VEYLGYSPVEAAFLCRVVIAGGYFLQRQFLAFSGQHPGHAVVSFTERLARRRHATVVSARHGTRVYHLCSRRLCEATGGDLRKRARRRRPAASVKVRLMALDVVLEQPSARFFANPEQRLTWLSTRALGDGCLPTRAFKAGATGLLTHRAFVENVMLGVVSESSKVDRPLWVFVDAGAAPVLGFEGFLRRYEMLFARLGTWRLVHASDATRLAVRAQRTYDRWADVYEGGNSLSTDDLLAYFRLREAYEAERWRDFTTDKLNAYLDTTQLLNGRADPLYARWLVAGDQVVVDAAQGGRPLSSLKDAGAFEAIVLPHTYPIDVPL
jgi:hypothetical protein